MRKAQYDFDESQVKPYFELNHVLQDGVFFAAHELYGITFKERNDLPVYQPDVRVFDVFDADGTPLGLFLLDYYARDNKHGGAWMNTLRRPVAPVRHTSRSSPTTSTSPSRRRASRRC